MAWVVGLVGLGVETWEASGLSVMKVGRMAMVGGAYTRDKNTRARTLAENVGGAYTRGEAYMRDTTVL